MLLLKLSKAAPPRFNGAPSPGAALRELPELPEALERRIHAAASIDTARICLRPVLEADEAFLLAVYASTRAQEMGFVGWTQEQQQTFLRMQFHAQDHHYRENYPGAQLQIIEVDGAPAGRLYVHRRQKEIRIMDVALLPSYQGCGVGTKLVKEILSEARRLKKIVTIHVELFNPALRWYERLGFRKIAENGPYLLMEWSAGASFS